MSTEQLQGISNIEIENTNKKNIFACYKEVNSIIIKQEDNLLKKKRRIKLISNIKEGRWDEEEHKRFLIACYENGENWQKIEEKIKTRNVVQIRSHAQKYLIKLCKKYSIKLNKKKFKNKKSVHLEWNEKEKSVKSSIHLMNKYDRNILDIFKYYERDYSKVNLTVFEQAKTDEDSSSHSGIAESNFTQEDKNPIKIISNEVNVKILRNAEINDKITCDKLNYSTLESNLILIKNLISIQQSNQIFLQNILNKNINNFYQNLNLVNQLLNQNFIDENLKINFYYSLMNNFNCKLN